MGEDATKSRKAKVTDEHREEAARLHEIWLREKPRLAAAGLGSQEAFGLHYGIGNQAAMTNFLRAQSALSLKAALAFARGLGVAVSDFSPRLAKQLRPGEIVPAPETAGGRIEMLGEIAEQLPVDRQGGRRRTRGTTQV